MKQYINITGIRIDPHEFFISKILLARRLITHQQQQALFEVPFRHAQLFVHFDQVHFVSYEVAVHFDQELVAFQGAQPGDPG